MSKKTDNNKGKSKSIFTIVFVGIIAVIISLLIFGFFIMSKNYTSYKTSLRDDLAGYKDKNYIFMLNGKEYTDIPDEVYDNPDDYTYMIVQNTVSIIKKK
jgi:flagellar basal body-associated protein FliL